ncbi:MAG: DinB family protein [Actinomycetes bacterium]
MPDMSDTDDPWASKDFAWQNRFVAPEDDPREQRPVHGGERAVLTTYLRSQRQTLALKCQGLSPEQLAMAAVPPSDLTLLGLVRHMATVEQGWFQRAMQGDDAPRAFRPTGTHSEEFSYPPPTGADVTAALEEWQRQCEASDAFIARNELDVRGEDGIELREVLVHMVEEYARHNGHADLLREAVDGRVGE